MVSHLKQEEKGTDVNLASHLLIDVLESRVSAALVLTNDSDLAFPIKVARSYVPVGTINPRGNHTAGRLKSDARDGVGSHWWYRLTNQDFLNNQMPSAIGNIHIPSPWQ